MSRLPLPSAAHDAIPVVLAPMSGLTDLPFRQLASRYGASAVVSEMVASERFAAGNEEEAIKGAVDIDGPGTIVQLAGCASDWMAEAAIRAEGEGAAAIDINMGCPAKKVVGGYGGSALMKDLDHALRLIDAVIAAVRVPVSVKMRLGWDDRTLNAPELARRAQGCGAFRVAVHGRTRCQFYQGSADWTAVARVVESVAIPVLVNGDIVDAALARTALERSGATGVMVGRAAIGQPWLLGSLAANLNGRTYRKPDVPEIAAVIEEHLGLSLALYGPHHGLLRFRKHLAEYLKHLAINRAEIAQLCQMGSERELNAGLRRVLDDTEAAAA